MNKRKNTNNFCFMFQKFDRMSQQQKTISGNNQINSEDELKKSAGELLNGVKRTVEVQVVNSSNTFNFQDQTILGMIYMFTHNICNLFKNNNKNLFVFDIKIFLIT